MRFTTPIPLIFCLFSIVQLSGQTVKNSSVQVNDAYQQARIYAFDEENYPKAIDYISEVLVQDPQNTEFQLFQNRLYFWGLQHEIALSNLNKFIEDNPHNLEAHNLLIDIYESQGIHNMAIEKCQTALKSVPQNLNLIFRLAYNQSQNEEFIEANNNCQFILSQDPSHKKAINLTKSIKPKLQKNFLITEYRYFFLDTPEQALNYYNLQYARKINRATLIGIVNMGKSFQDKGFQYVLEMYNDLGKEYYSYAHIGYSNSRLFPGLRINAAIYKAMSKRMEGSIFISILKSDDQLIRVLSPSLTKNIGKSAFTLTGNIINKSFKNEITYRARFRQYILNSTNYVGVAIGSFSRDENVGQRTEEDLMAKYISYQAQINLGLDVIFGVNYNRSITIKANARDQLSAYLKHSF